MLTKTLSAKAAVAAAAILFGVGTAAAAGALPGAAQDAASDALETVGVSVPGANNHSDGHADTRGKSADDHTSSDASDTNDDTDGTDGDASEATTPETGPNAHAEFGLCTAQAAGGQAHADAFPFDCDASHPGNSDDSSGKPEDPGSQGRAHHPADPSASSAGADNRGNHGRS